MITNNDITIYHKTYNKETRLNEWIRKNYDNVWKHGGKGSSLNKGFADANDVDIRIPYKTEEIAVGDIIVIGHIETEITVQDDLKQYEVYNVRSITINDFGNNPHTHLGGK